MSPAATCIAPSSPPSASPPTRSTADSTARLYRTGDFARYRADGNIEFIGRRDQQVKIRGFRIEPGEVEAVLASHPAVAGCAVVVAEVRPGEHGLVAYYAAAEGATLSREAARGFLRSKLPEHMVPAVFVTLPSLPLTPNGKVDRSRLPEPREAPEADRVRSRAPGDQLELHLVKLWERMLGAEGIGIHDDFFELGGHSLLAAQLFDEIERLFGRRLPLDTLWYKGASIADVAHLLREDVQSITWPILVPIKPSGSKPPLFVVHTMGGNLFHYDYLARTLDPRQPVMGLQARGVYGREQPRHRIEDIAADCVRALRSHQAQGPYLIAGYSSAGIVAFEIARQLEARWRKGRGACAYRQLFSARKQKALAFPGGWRNASPSAVAPGSGARLPRDPALDWPVASTPIGQRRGGAEVGLLVVPGATLRRDGMPVRCERVARYGP